MESIEMIISRHSVSNYNPEIVSKVLLEQIVEAARFAPSWGNTQIARYNFVQDEEIIKKLSESCVNGFVYNTKVLKFAKNVLVLSYVKGKSGQFEKEKAEAMGLNEGYVSGKGDSWEEFDAGIMAHSFCLAAHAMGVGTCIMGVINSAEIAKAINLPENEAVAALITFGHPDETPRETPRNNVEDIVRFV